MGTLLNVVNGPWENGNEINIVVWCNTDSGLVISVDMRDKAGIFCHFWCRFCIAQNSFMRMYVYLSVFVFILAWLSD